MEVVGGAAGCTTKPDPPDQTIRLQSKMTEPEKDGGGGKSGSKKEKDQVCSTMMAFFCTKKLFQTFYVSNYYH